MSTIVLVHGIAQEQLSADTLESQWLPALAGGVRNSGNHELADRLWRGGRPGEISVRMAYYGAQYLEKGAQGVAAATDLDENALDFAEQLALAWLETANEFGDSKDRREAAMQLASIDRAGKGQQGVRAALRPALNGLTKLRWFAPFGIGLASKFTWRALTQVTRYFTDDEFRVFAQDQVLAHIGDETRLVIGHSLGSVVAYEALHRTDHRTALLTLGSPLGLQNVVYDRLRPPPPNRTVPACVTRWDNLVDNDDLVAAHRDLAPFFPPAAESDVKPVTAQSVDNGAKPHEGIHYLTKRTTGRIISEALTEE
ncbi:hypothetical protein WSS_A34337 [Rhodococcus opacus M213]|uniref:Uncharacterized protein n=1 Tax=Rhodococcus opacus M213 TaxID=1129896 RepID=K8XIH3_RHOOP|nr:hypothetical protein [Rhodococcus opacus]EKT78097.1 hypothetical protein WSS_A34337 [Rhodococcus opacus M213]